MSWAPLSTVKIPVPLRLRTTEHFHYDDSHICVLLMVLALDGSALEFWAICQFFHAEHRPVAVFLIEPKGYITKRLPFVFTLVGSIQLVEMSHADQFTDHEYWQYPASRVWRPELGLLRLDS